MFLFLQLLGDTLERSKKLLRELRALPCVVVLDVNRASPRAVETHERGRGRVPNDVRVLPGGSTLPPL
jgi:hypothetical protein